MRNLFDKFFNVPIKLPQTMVYCDKIRENGETRYVPINVTALAALSELRKRGDGTGAVIRNLQGMSLTDPRHWFEAAIRMAKIRGFSWHCLRHTFASRLVMAGIDLRTVRELLGHKSHRDDRLVLPPSSGTHARRR